MDGRKGFTLVELLVVIAVLAILSTITIGGARMVQQTARARRFNVTKEVLRTAIARYRTEYNKWPVEPDDSPDHAPNKGYYIWQASNAAIIDALRQDGKGNPDKIRFIDETTILTPGDSAKAIPLSSAASSGCPAVYVTKDGTSVKHFSIEINFEYDTVAVGGKVVYNNNLKMYRVSGDMEAGTSDDEY